MRSVKFKIETWMEVPIPVEMDNQELINYLSSNPNRRQLADHLGSKYSMPDGETSYPIKVLSMVELRPTSVNDPTVILSDQVYSDGIECTNVIWKNI